MWVVFRKSDGAVISTSPSTGGESRKREVLEEVVRGQVGSPSATEFDIVETKDPTAASRLSRVGRRARLSVRVKSDGTAQVLDETPDAASVRITTNAKEFHPVDNVPLIPADGSSFLVVTLQKVSEQGQTLSRGADNEVIWLRTDHGSLRDDTENPREIRSVTLVNGTARFRIQSGTQRRLATVQLLSANPDLQLGGLQVEFI